MSVKAERFSHHIKKMLADSLIRRYPHLEQQSKIKDLELDKYEPLAAKHFIVLKDKDKELSEQTKKTLNSFSFSTEINLVKNPKATDIDEHDLVHLVLEKKDWVDFKTAKKKLARQLELGLTKGALFVIECFDFQDWSNQSQQSFQEELFKHLNPRVIVVVHHNGERKVIKKEEQWSFFEVITNQ